MAFVIALILAFIIAGTLGTKRKIGFGWSLVACIFTSPIIGLIITLCSEKLPEEQPASEAEEEKPLADVLTEASETPAEPAEEAPVIETPAEETIVPEDSTSIDY